MIFLIEYHRSEGRIVTYREFDDVDLADAEDARLEIELELNRQGVRHEVVLLNAASKEALMKTHRRYFADLIELSIMDDE
ncbi:MAG: hypothetical protein R3C01_11320 [Planctomycetaceae bacterium]